VDTGATFTILSKDVAEEVGAAKLPATIELELGDGRRIGAEAYGLALRIGEREGPAIVASFEGAKPVLGVQSLESLGLKVDPVSGRLEPTRPAGVAYYYATRQRAR